MSNHTNTAAIHAHIARLHSTGVLSQSEATLSLMRNRLTAAQAIAFLAVTK
jgi:hypothetical protein